MMVPNTIDSTANFRVCVSPHKQAVEMHQNRAELQGGLHGHPVTAQGSRGRRCGPAQIDRTI